jgi:hypothetical protein
LKPFSEASARNRGPILEVLKEAFADATLVLEIGSGTGQHAAYFAPALSHLTWQASDVAENLPGIRQWGIEPVELDVDGDWPEIPADAAFTANTCHILSWAQVQRMFAGLERLGSVRTFCVYGPFHYGGKPTSESNARFDAMLRARDALGGVRDFEAIRDLAGRHGFALAHDHAMPANNRLLVLRR